MPILCRAKLVGVINVQHREPPEHSRHQVHLISTIGFLVGPEFELARMEAESMKSSDLAEARCIVEAAKKILAGMLKIDEDDAYLVLEQESRQRRKSMKQLAEAILLVESLREMRTTGSGAAPAGQPRKAKLTRIFERKSDENWFYKPPS